MAISEITSQKPKTLFDESIALEMDDLSHKIVSSVARIRTTHRLWNRLLNIHSKLVYQSRKRERQEQVRIWPRIVSILSWSRHLRPKGTFVERAVSLHRVSLSSLVDMCAQLPIEVWKKIVSYLPVGGVKELYTVNSALFNIAMDLRYQVAWLCLENPKALVHECLRVFRCVIFE